MLDTIEFTLGDKTYSVRPSFGAIVKIEKKLGRSILAFLSSAQKAEGVSLTDIVTVAHEALRAEGVKIDHGAVGQQMMESGGIAKFVEPVARYLSNAITAGPENASGEMPDGDSKS